VGNQTREDCGGRLPAIAEVLSVTASWLTDDSGTEREAASQLQNEHGVPVLLEANLAREARDLGIAISSAVGRHLRQLVKEARQQRWTEDANAFLER
jgi:post-segregation antitoxin (ccd killing protein)